MLTAPRLKYELPVRYNSLLPKFEREAARPHRPQLHRTALIPLIAGCMRDRHLYYFMPRLRFEQANTRSGLQT